MKNVCHKILKTTFSSVYWRNVSKIQVFLEACRRSRPTSLVSVNDVTYCQLVPLVQRLHICSYRLVTLVSLAICNNLCLLRLIWACGFLPCQVNPPKRIWIGSIQLHSYNHSPVLRIPSSISQVILFVLVVLVVLTCSILKVSTVESIESTSASNAIFSAIRTGCFNVCILLYHIILL